MNKIDPWPQIVSGLHSRTGLSAHLGPKPAVHGSRECCNSMTSAMANASSIRRIEWQTTCTILVSWSDSMLGRYEDQTWRAGFARTAGICAVTGVPVRPGDAVFRPLLRGGRTARNALYMILADMLREETDVDAR